MDPLRQYGRAKIFILSFVVSLLVIGFMVVFLLFQLFVPPVQVRPSAPVNPSTVYLPGVQDRLTLLVAVEGQTTDTFVLLGFYPDIGYMPVMTLPRQLGLGDTTLQQLYRSRGIEPTRLALEENFGLTVDRTAAIPGSNFAGLLNRVGSVDFRLPVRLNDSASGLVLAVGLHQFDGSKTLTLMNCQNWPGGEGQRCGVVSSLLTEAVDQHLPLVLGDRAESLFKTAVNGCTSTTLSLLDYETYLPAARFMARLEVSPGQALELSGSYNGSGIFMPDTAGVDLLHNTYKKAHT